MNYDNLLSDRVKEIKPSGIRKFFDILDEMDDVISLTVGQPDFATPWHIRDAGIQALEQGKTYYTSNNGLMEMRAEITRYLARRFNLNYCAKNEIIVTIGGSEAIDLAIRALVNRGDEVIIPTPSYVCYEPMVTLVDGVPVIIKTKEEDNFKLNPNDLRAAITDKTKLLILPFPNNPTGAVMTKEELEEIAEIIRGTDIMVLSDEIYGELTYGFTHTSIATLEGMWERTLVVNGFSKAYAMTGWRMGYICGPSEIITQMVKIHQYAIMCAPTISQYAAIEALKNGDEDIEYMKGEYDLRRQYLVKALRGIGLECFEPHGAFYVFPNISGFGMTSEEFCERLLHETHVAIVPGTAFGECGEGFARISYAYSLDHLKIAVEKMDKFIKSIKNSK